MRAAFDQALIDKIERIRRDNNTRWMDLVRLAFRVAPQEARTIMAAIVAGDEQVATLAGELSRD